jgi:nucleoside phosphorylase
MDGLPHVRVQAVVLGTIVLSCTIAPGVAAMQGPARQGLCETVAARDGSTRLAVLSAFPAELAPLVARAVVRERVEVDGRTYFVGELEGVRVVLGLLGIGMVNAATTAESLLAHLDVAGLVVSGVAGSPQRIGDVAVPARWLERDTGAIFTANPVLLELARQLTDVALERCTPVPPPAGATVCLPHEPALLVGGLGQSGDPFAGTAVRCQPGGGEVFGCELPEPLARIETTPEVPVVEDMETAAVARVAAAHRIPLLAFRAVSDGAGDPLGLPGFPAQFFAYYPLAAHNAAASTLALLDRVAQLGDGRRAHRRLCRLLARERWRRAVRILRSRRG